MTNKIISSVILTASIVFFALSSSQPDNLLFLFLSPDQSVGLSRILLAIGMVAVSFKSFLSSERLRSAAKYGGLALMAFGMSTILFTSLSSALYSYIKLLDVMIIAEAGIIYTSCALTLPKQYVSTKMKPAKNALSLKQRTA